MNTVTRCLIILLFLAATCRAVRDLYRDADNGFGKKLDFPQGKSSNARIVRIGLGDNFKMFGRASKDAFVSFIFLLLILLNSMQVQI